MKDKLTKKDVGFVEDAITVLLNLVHIEEHCQNSFFITEDVEWLKLGNEARKDRTELLDLITKNENSELWCYNKHSLVVILGYRELANRRFSEGKYNLALHYHNLSGKWLAMFYAKNKLK